MSMQLTNIFVCKNLNFNYLDLSLCPEILERERERELNSASPHVLIPILLFYFPGGKFCLSASLCIVDSYIFCTIAFPEKYYLSCLPTVYYSNDLFFLLSFKICIVRLLKAQLSRVESCSDYMSLPFLSYNQLTDISKL